MTISSRTPEGLPNRCPICGSEFVLDPSRPSGDAPCPSCGQLVWWFQEKLSARLECERERITLNTQLFSENAGDSLDIVELVMELEELAAELGVELIADDIRGFKTIGDAIRFLQERRKWRPSDE